MTLRFLLSESFTSAGHVVLFQPKLGSSDINGNQSLPSFAAGLPPRAGGFPQVSLPFACAGNEGTHGVAYMKSSLLGGSLRPGFY
jgi:hypothetical protein